MSHQQKQHYKQAAPAPKPANLNPHYMAVAVRHAAYGPNMMLTPDEAAHESIIQNIVALSRVMSVQQYETLRQSMAHKEEQPDGTTNDVDPADFGAQQ
jgi:hypothetical protein